MFGNKIVSAISVNPGAILQSTPLMFVGAELFNKLNSSKFQIVQTRQHLPVSSTE